MVRLKLVGMVHREVTQRWRVVLLDPKAAEIGRGEAC